MYFNVHPSDTRSKGIELSESTAKVLITPPIVSYQRYPMVLAYRGSREGIMIHELLVTEGCNIFFFFSWRQDHNSQTRLWMDDSLQNMEND